MPSSAPSRRLVRNDCGGSSIRRWVRASPRSFRWRSSWPLRLLQDLPCQLGQGFLIARPQTAEAITTLLESGFGVQPDSLTSAAPE
jgi:hypothetical protein